MNASPNEVQLILNAIDDIRSDIKSVRNEITEARAETARMDARINGRIRRLEQFRWQLVGAATVVMVVGGMVLDHINF